MNVAGLCTLTCLFPCTLCIQELGKVYWKGLKCGGGEGGEISSLIAKELWGVGLDDL